MATLRQVTNASRHILAISALTVIGIFLLVVVINIVKSINQSLHPTPPPPPTVSFGKLPPITFPASSPAQQQYTLDTLSGSLPDFGDRATVYKIDQPQPTLLALDSAKQLVTQANFTGDPTRISDTTYQWTNADDLPKTIALNIFTNNFNLSSDFLSNSDVLQGNNLPNENGAIDTATSYLQLLNLLPTDIDTNKTKATLLSIADGNLTPATSLSSTQIIRVDFFQKDMNKLPIFYPDATYSTMSFFVAGSKDQPQVVKAHFTHQNIGSDNATYPIITAQQAFDALKKGEAYISSPNTTGSVTIHNVVLGYYMGDNQQQYLQPIIVFEGDNGFFAYVPAVSSDWIAKE